MLLFVIKYIILSLIVIFSMLLAVSFFTLLERKVLAGIQRRHGPIFTGYFGLLQPFADGLKLFLKEISIPAGGYYYVFLGASVLSLTLSLLSWSVIPFSSKFVIADLNFGMLFILFISSLNVYATLFSGWSSNSKYGLLGSIRSGAQMISYELPMTLTLLPIALYTSSFNLTNIVIFQQENFWFVLFIPVAYIFFVAALAETNRTPFDLPEAESELVAGYNIEYSSLPFAFFFLAEYNHMLVMSFLFSILFLGGWSNFSNFFITDETYQAVFEALAQEGFFDVTSTFFYRFVWFVLFYTNETIEISILTIKALLIVLLFISIRAVAPRYKYIQLIKMCWSVFIPVLLFYLTLVVYTYAGAMNTIEDYEVVRVQREVILSEYDVILNNRTEEDILLEDFMSYFPNHYDPFANEDFSWTYSKYFDRVWSDQRFIKYLLVKYDYIYEPSPLLSFYLDSRDSEVAFKFLSEYYQFEYWDIFEPCWCDRRTGNSSGGMPWEIIDDRLLELHFKLKEGTVKPYIAYY